MTRCRLIVENIYNKTKDVIAIYVKTIQDKVDTHNKRAKAKPIY